MKVFFSLLAFLLSTNWCKHERMELFVSADTEYTRQMMGTRGTERRQGPPQHPGQGSHGEGGPHQNPGQNNQGGDNHDDSDYTESDSDIGPCPDGGLDHKVTICHYEKEEATYQTMCVATQGAENGHLRQHENDYKGECLRDIFVRQSLTTDTPEEAGTEDIAASVNGAIYEVIYDVVFRKQGIVALGGTDDYVEQVTCAILDADKGTVTIKFSLGVSSTDLNEMFPTGSVLFVEATRYGQCELLSPSNPLSSPKNGDGYLILESSMLDMGATSGSTVVLQGYAGTFNSIFSYKSLSYSLKSEDRSRNLQENKASFSVNLSPFDAVAAEAGFQVTPRVDLTLHEEEFEADLFGFSVEVNSEFTFRLDLELDFTIILKATRELFEGEKTLDLEEVPITALSLPSTLETIIKKILKYAGAFIDLEPEVGLLLDIDAVAEAAISLEREISYGVEAKTSTGTHGFRMKIDGGSGNLGGLVPTLQLLSSDADEDATGVEFKNPSEVEVSAGLALSFFVGFIPALEVSVLGLGEIRLGADAGFSIGGKVEASVDPDYDGDFINVEVVEPPISESDVKAWVGAVGCDVCHIGEFDVNFMIKDPFFESSLGDASLSAIELDDLAFSIPLVKWCPFPSLVSGEIPGVITCGDICCNAITDVCIEDCNLAFCSHTCCNKDNECGNECCSDGGTCVKDDTLTCCATDSCEENERFDCFLKKCVSASESPTLGPSNSTSESPTSGPSVSTSGSPTPGPTVTATPSPTDNYAYIRFGFFWTQPVEDLDGGLEFLGQLSGSGDFQLDGGCQIGPYVKRRGADYYAEEFFTVDVLAASKDGEWDTFCTIVDLFADFESLDGGQITLSAVFSEDDLGEVPIGSETEITVQAGTDPTRNSCPSTKVGTARITKSTSATGLPFSFELSSGDLSCIATQSPTQ